MMVSKYQKGMFTLDNSSCLNIAGYCRISVDEEADKSENTSIENQKAIINEFVKTRFPNAILSFYEDRDRSGYTFEQRVGYQLMRKKLMNKEHDVLIVKDFSRFARRNSKGLVELEELRDNGVRIIAIGDAIDYPTHDDWMQIQFRFLINEMPVTDASKKVKSVIANRQKEGKWLCAVPFGYMRTGAKKQDIVIDEETAPIVRKIFDLYTDGMGYRKIANYLTDNHIPTPRMLEYRRRVESGEECGNREIKSEWSVVSVSEILHNDFYIGTLRQGKYKRKKINGSDFRTDESEHIVFENNHEPLIEYRKFLAVQQLLKARTNGHYRGIKKYDNVYSGFVLCGDCGSPMFSISSSSRAPAYTCGLYHKRGLAGCTSHFIKCETMDAALKEYVRLVRDNSQDMIKKLDVFLREEKIETGQTMTTVEILQQRIKGVKSEMKLLMRQKIKEIARNPENEALFEETYGEMLDDLANQIDSLESQIELMTAKQSAIVRINRTAKTAIDIFNDIVEKDKLTRTDLDVIIDKILVYEDRVEVKLKPNIDMLLNLDVEREITANFNYGTVDNERCVAQLAANRKPKVYRVNVLREGDPLEIFTNPDGEVIFKKYSPVGEITDTAAQYAEVLAKIGGCPAAICDRDHVIAASGIQKKEILERRVSSSLEDLIEQRKSHAYRTFEDKRLNPIEGIDKYAIACTPIVSQGDVNGAVMMLSSDGNEYATPEQLALVQAAAMYFGKQMEE